MQILINIPDEEYELIIGDEACGLNTLTRAVARGVVLPKGHGRLIDADDLDVITITTDDYSGNEILDVILKEDLDDAPTIIEADNGDQG